MNDNPAQTIEPNAPVTTNTEPDPSKTGGPIPDPTPVSPPPDAVESEAPPPSMVEGSVEGAAPVTAEDLSLPEGLTLEGELQDKFLAAINTADPKERANALVGLHAEVLQGAADEYAARWEQLETEWKGEIQTAFPGAQLPQAQAEIAKVLDRYGDKAVRDAFAVTGAGNNPAIFRFLVGIARDLNERPPVGGTPPSATPKDRASRMFGSNT